MKLGQAYKMGQRWTPSLKSFEECISVCDGCGSNDDGDSNQDKTDIQEGGEDAIEEAEVTQCRITALRCLSEANIAIAEYDEAITNARNGLVVLEQKEHEEHEEKEDIEKCLLQSSLSIGLFCGLFTSLLCWFIHWFISS